MVTTYWQRKVIFVWRDDSGCIPASAVTWFLAVFSHARPSRFRHVSVAFGHCLRFLAASRASSRNDDVFRSCFLSVLVVKFHAFIISSEFWTSSLIFFDGACQLVGQFLFRVYILWNLTIGQQGTLSSSGHTEKIIINVHELILVAWMKWNFFFHEKLVLLFRLWASLRARSYFFLYQLLLRRVWKWFSKHRRWFRSSLAKFRQFWQCPCWQFEPLVFHRV